MLSVKKNDLGSTIIESLVAIGLISFFIAIFGASSIVIDSNQFLRHKNLANFLVLEEIEALRETPISNLTTRTNTSFIEVGYNTGTWRVLTDGTAPSSSNIYNVTSPAGNPSGVTGLAIIPGFEYEDYTYIGEIKSNTSSPSNWESGLYFRYHDLNNYYVVYFTSSNLYIKKNVNGSISTLDSINLSFSKNVWYNLKLVATDDNFDVYVDDILKLSTNDSANTFTKGRLALYAGNSANNSYDNVSIDAGSIKTWDFDSDTVGEIPASWKRFGINDLPSATTKLTIEEPEVGYSDFKKVIVRLEWQEKNRTANVEISTFLTQK